MLIQMTALMVMFEAPYDEYGQYAAWPFDNYAQCSRALDHFEEIKGPEVAYLNCLAMVEYSDLAPKTSPVPRARPTQGE
jgi:hypothetical protein